MKTPWTSTLLLYVLVVGSMSVLLVTIYYSILLQFGEKNGHLFLNLPVEPVGSLSVLGRRLFLGEFKNLKPRPKNFSILIWKFGPMMEKRHINHFSSETFDPFEGCSVSNCRITYNDSDLLRADAVLFHLQQIRGPETLPQGPRPSTQRWVFLTDESPYNTFVHRNSRNKLNRYNGFFNWTMTYRSDSDVPVAYGRTIPLSPEEKQRMLKSPLENPTKGKSGLAAIMVSDCYNLNRRITFANRLKEHIPVDIYGACGTLKCFGDYTRDCPLLNKYKFYLAFENSNCREYLTEKVWWNAFAKGAVPVVMGASLEDYTRLLPPDSFIHVDPFTSPADLAKLLLRLNASDELYSRYFRWKKDYKVVNEHGYFQTPVFHYCRLCEALNYNDQTPKVYEDLTQFWSVERDCYKIWTEF